MTQALRLQIITQVTAKRLGCRQEDTSVGYGIATHKVELSVGMWFHIGIQTVQSHHLQQGGLLQLLFREVGQIGTCGVALVLDVHAELLLLYRRGQIIDVLHHQAPVGLLGIVRGIFQRLHEEALVGLCDVGRELTHLIGLSTIGIFKGYGQHLVGLQACLQCHITQSGVQGIFAR